MHFKLEGEESRALSFPTAHNWFVLVVVPRHSCCLQKWSTLLVGFFGTPTLENLNVRCNVGELHIYVLYSVGVVRPLIPLRLQVTTLCE